MLNIVFRKFKITIITCLILVMILPLPAQMSMRSSNYIINENVDYEFSGPVISAISAGISDSTSITITWTTDVVADSFVVYDTNSSFTTSQEQGLSDKTSASHSVTVTGLLPSTTYYFEVKSTALSNGSTVSSQGGSFTTTAATTVSTGGGGVLIIDKTDSVAPVITDIKIENIKSDSVIVSWATDEEANSFIEYGRDINFGSTFGQWDSVMTHSVQLENLWPETDYAFRALSSDAAGNLSISENVYFKTKSYIEELGDQGIDQENFNEKSLLERFNLIQKLADAIPAPIITGEPSIDVWSDRVIVIWASNKNSNSLVAFAPEADFNADLEEPYVQVTGNPEENTKEHRIEIIGLEPNTIYHYQIRMKPALGSLSKSEDFTFRTIEEDLNIDNYFIDVIDDNNVRFKWLTNLEADSAVKLTPYRGNILAVEEAKVTRDNLQAVIHDLVISGIAPGVAYDIELISADNRGNIAIEVIKSFSTAEDNEAPVVAQVKTSSTIFLNKNDKVQTIISWKTNEPANSRVYYLEGVHSAKKEWPKKSEWDNNYTKNHVVIINNFKPGTVYSFRIENSDSNENASISKVYTFITPKKQESIFQLIINIFENLFGWIFNR